MSIQRTLQTILGKAVIKLDELKQYTTKELFQELKCRDGISEEYAEPHKDKKLSVNGPAEILIIID